MAAVTPTIRTVGAGNFACRVATWASIGDSDTCTPVSFPDLTDRSVQVFGTFGGASIAIQGSNDAGTTFAPLNDPGGTVIGITTAKIKAILENSEQIKPVTSGGTGSSLTVCILFHLSQALRA